MATFGMFRRLLGNASERRLENRVKPSRGSQVLVVDDSSTIRAVLGKMLTQDGYTVLKAEDGERAMVVALTEQPDLIFLDIVLPGMNGFAVLRALRRDERTKNIPIIMISGNLQATEQFYVQRFGADDFMKKPFGRAEVFERIRQLISNGRLVLNPLSAEDMIADAAVAADEMDQIPDVAMPDADYHGAHVDVHQAPPSASNGWFKRTN